MDHEPEDAHHGRASVIQLYGALGELGVVAELVPPEVDGAVPEVAHEFVAGARDVLHDGSLEESDEEEDLRNAVLGDGIGAVECRPAVSE